MYQVHTRVRTQVDGQMEYFNKDLKFENLWLVLLETHNNVGLFGRPSISIHTSVIFLKYLSTYMP